MDSSQQSPDRRSPETHPPQLQDPSHPYAFLVHSQSTLDRNLPPKVDNKILARQKRRRTSPEDHAILEAAYQQNSKPDKAARAEIVKRVALEEKAVQIWFQNRRQNDRRKSRPLLPHELIPHLRNHPSTPFQNQYSFEHNASSSPNPGHPVESAATGIESSPTTTSPIPRSPTEERAPSRGSSIQDLLNPTDSKSGAPPSFSSSSPISSPSTLESTLNQNGSTQPTSVEGGAVKERSPSPADMTPSGKKRSFDEVEGTEGANSLGTTPPLPSSQEKSNVRLSMSLDGAVKVKMNKEETPSPPKQRFLPPNPELKRVGGLQRSLSEVAVGNTSPEESRSQPKQTGGLFGRSRDARTWEFFCDSDARDALATQAERERSGSAVGAISLIRSQSKKSKENLKAQQRREALLPKASAANMQRTGSGSRPKLHRAKSSMGRLQHDENDSFSLKDGQRSMKIFSSKPTYERSPSGDSDKENWAPGTHASNIPPRRRLLHPDSSSRPILQETDALPPYHPSDLVSAKRARTSKRGLSLIDVDKENRDGRGYDSDEVTSFMTNQDSEKVGVSGRHRVNTTDKSDDDLDCIQGLLSLSQGAWR